jgi:hypothetical protein
MAVGISCADKRLLNELHRMLFIAVSGIQFDDIFAVVKIGSRHDQQT